MRNEAFDNYCRLCEIIVEEKIYMCSCLSFRDICRLSGADYRAVRGMMMSELGVSGEELMSRLREGEMKRVLQKLKSICAL